MRLSNLMSELQEATAMPPYKRVMTTMQSVVAVAKSLKAKAQRAPEKLVRREKDEFEQHLDEIDALVKQAREAIRRW